MTIEIDPPTIVSDPPASKGPPFNVSVSGSDEGVVLVVEGELDMSTAPILREALIDVTGGLEGDLMLDIGLLTFIDSSGLALFVAEHKKLESLGHKLVIFAATPWAIRLFEIAGLHKVLTVRPG